MKSGSEYTNHVNHMAGVVRERRQAPVKAQNGMTLKSREDTLDRIGMLYDELQALEHELNLTIGAAKACTNGPSWSELAGVTGFSSKQGASQRFKAAAETYDNARRDADKHAEDRQLVNLYKRVGIITAKAEGGRWAQGRTCAACGGEVDYRPTAIIRPFYCPTCRHALTISETVNG